MFAAEPKLTMTDHMESYLAKRIGKDSWPFVRAELESRLLIPGSNFKRTLDVSRYEVYAYEVDDVLYTVSIRTASGYQERSQVGDSVMIQYNPVKPAVAYYAPACVLADRFVTLLVVFGGVAAVALAASGILEQY